MLIPLFQLLSSTFKMYQKYFGLYVGYVAWMLIPILVIFILEISMSGTEIGNGLLTLANIAYVILAIWVAVVLTIATANIVKKKKLQTAVMSKEAWTLLFPVLWVGLLVGLIQFAGFILLIIPGFIFIVWFAFVQYEIVLNNARGLESLKASRALSKGRFFPILIRVLIGPLILVFIYSILAAIVIGVVELVIGGSIDQPSMASQILISVMQIIYVPLYIIYPTLLYLDIIKKPINSSK